MSAAAAGEPEFKTKIRTFDGRDAEGADVADCYDPDCKLGCDVGLLTRLVPFRGGAQVPRTDVCSCAILRWQKKNPKEAPSGS